MPDKMYTMLITDNRKTIYITFDTNYICLLFFLKIEWYCFMCYIFHFFQEHASKNTEF